MYVPGWPDTCACTTHPAQARSWWPQLLAQLDRLWPLTVCEAFFSYDDGPHGHADADGNGTATTRNSMSELLAIMSQLPNHRRIHLIRRRGTYGLPWTSSMQMDLEQMAKLTSARWVFHLMDDR